MRRLKLERSIVSGTPTSVRDVRIIPQSRTLVVRFSGGGLVWNRPTAVLVERNGQTRRIPIYDLTRLLQIGLFGIAFAVVVAWAATSTWRKERHSGRHYGRSHYDDE